VLVCWGNAAIYCTVHAVTAGHRWPAADKELRGAHNGCTACAALRGIHLAVGVGW